MLHLPANPDGIAWANVQALRRRGAHAELAVFDDRRVSVLGMPREATGLARIERQVYPETDWIIDLPPLNSGLARVHAFARLTPKFDAFHFYGGTLLPSRMQFRLLRLTRRRSLVHLVGRSETNAAWCDRATVRLADSYATELRAAGATVIPPGVALDSMVPIPPRDVDRPLVLLGRSARTHSARVAAACDALGAELEVVEDVHHTQVFERCKAADVVVDDLAGRWYGTFAIDAMALGKPVIASLDDEGRRRTETAFGIRVPVVPASPETVEARLRSLVGDPAERRRVGSASRAYVERVHDADEVADRLLDVYARL